MISCIFIFLAAICNAVMDVSLFHWHKSIFTKKGFARHWWDGTISWKNKYVDGEESLGRKEWRILNMIFIKPVQLTDAFHFFKMLMWGFIIISVVVYKPLINIYLDFVILSTVFIQTFNLFYNRVLKLKNK